MLIAERDVGRAAALAYLAEKKAERALRRKEIREGLLFGLGFFSAMFVFMAL